MADDEDDPRDARTDEQLANCLRQSLALARASKAALVARGFAVDMRPKVPTIRRIKTTTTEL